MRKSGAFENRDVVALVGVPERALRHWADRGVVVPEVADAVGRPGIRRRYSFANLVECGIVKELLHYGINLHQARGILVFLRKSLYFERWPAQCFLVIQQGAVVEMLIDPARRGDLTNLIAWSPKSPGRPSTRATLGQHLERIMRRGGGLVVAVHDIRDELAAQVPLPSFRSP